ncbi:MAG: regulatory protein GemA [Thermodesulfobacteriota bacterium]
MNLEKSRRLSKGQIALVHVARRRLGLTEDEYRAALEAHGGAASAKDLSQAGFKAVMEHFEHCGFRPALSLPEKNRPGMATYAQLRKIKALWCNLEGWYEKDQVWRALRGFLKSRFGVDHEKFLDFEAAHKVIEALKAINIRRTGHAG